MCGQSLVARRDPGQYVEIEAPCDQTQNRFGVVLGVIDGAALRER
jgi:hypothetical protein